MKFRTRLGKLGIGLFTLVICLALSGCGDGLSGHKFVEKDGKDGIEFKSSHKAYVTFLGQTMEADYSVDGDKITLDTHSNAGRVVLTRGSDGTITGMPGLGTLTKTP